MGRSSSRLDEREDPLDYDCVERFRLRRLLAYLRFYRYDGAFEALSKETTVLFRPEHLQHLVRRGLWSDAIEYFHSFAPPMLLPRSAKLLLKFIRFLSCIFDEDAAYEYDPYNPVQISLYGGANPGGVKLANIISFVRSEQARGSINWLHVRLKAAEIVGHWVAQIPEFNEMRRLPLCPTKPANVLPIGPSSRAPRGIRKKRSVRIPADVLARSFLSKKRLPSSSKGTSHSGLSLEPATMTRLTGLIEECLQAGKGMVPNAKYLIGSSHAEGMKMIVHQDNVPGNNPKRPRVVEHQVFDTRKRQITGKLCQDSCLSSRAPCLVEDGRVGDLESNMGSCSGEGGGWSSSTEIESS